MIGKVVKIQHLGGNFERHNGKLVKVIKNPIISHGQYTTLFPNGKMFFLFKNQMKVAKSAEIDEFESLKTEEYSEID